MFFFSSSSSSLLLDQDNIYRDAKLPHCQKKKIALQNMKTEERVIVKSLMRFVMEAPEVSQVPVGTAVDCTLCFFYSFTVTLHHTTHRRTSAIISVFDTQFYHFKILSTWLPSLFTWVLACFMTFFNSKQNSLNTFDHQSWFVSQSVTVHVFTLTKKEV